MKRPTKDTLSEIAVRATRLHKNGLVEAYRAMKVLGRETELLQRRRRNVERGSRACSDSAGNFDERQLREV